MDQCVESTVPLAFSAPPQGSLQFGYRSWLDATPIWLLLLWLAWQEARWHGQVYMGFGRSSSLG